MKGKRYSIEQKIRIVRAAQECGNTSEVCQKYNLSENTFYRWKKEIGTMDLSQAKKLKDLEEENEELKRIVADQMLNIKVLERVVEKKL